MRRLLLTTSTTAWLTGLYLLYSVFVSPAIEPRALKLASPAATEAPPANRDVEAMRLAEMYLPTQPWAPSCNYQLRMAGTFIYTQAWEQPEAANDGEIRFRPFAMIWMKPDGGPDDEPLTIVCDVAVVRFKSKLDMVNPQPGRVVGGAFEGTVRIRGADGLSIDGRNFIFDEAALRLWSDNQVAFAYGQHAGTGHGLQVELIPQEGDVRKDKPAISGIRTVTVRRKVKLQLAADKAKLPSASQSHPADARAVAKDKPEVVTIRSDGSFRYDVLNHLMKFETDVRVTRPTAPNEFDALLCERLSMWFVPTTEFLPPADDSDPDEWFPKRLEFQRLLAEGTEKKRLMLVSQHNDVRAALDELTYDGRERVVTLRDGKDVCVEQGASEIHGPEFLLTHALDGTLVSAVCRGPGWLKTGQATEGFAVQWGKELRKLTEPAGGPDVIELDQDVRFQDSADASLAADFVKLWLTGTDNATPGVTRKRKGQAQTEPRQAKVDRILGVGNVTLHSPRMSGRANRFEIGFEDGKVPTKRSGTGTRRKGSDDSSAAAPADVDDKTAVLDQPFNLAADSVRVRVLRDPQDSRLNHVAEVWGEGAIALAQERPNGEAPFRVDGQKLHVVNNSEFDQTIHLHGNPGHVRDRGMHLEGNDLHVDRAANRMWVDGAGLLQLPVNSTLEGKPLDKPQVLDVWWREKMEFDGHTAHFIESVRAVLNETRMRCQTMDVTLTERISFSIQEPRQPGEQTRIKHLTCRDGVELEEYEYADSRMIGVRRGKVWEFTADSISGETRAQGPGHLDMWRRGGGNRAALAPTKGVKANRPLSSETSDWEYTHVDFAGPVKGNLNDRFATFNDRVRIIYGPVVRATDTIDPDNLPDNGGWMRCDTLQFTQQGAPKSPNAYLQVLATGNARLEGQTFYAVAESISFDESKGLYVLRSPGAQKATIFRQAKAGAPVARAVAQRMDFNPSTNELKLDQTTGLDGLQ